MSLAHALAKQELALALVAEGGEKWVDSEEEVLEADYRTQSEEEEDDSATSASAPYDANAAFVAARCDANAAFVAAFAAASEENARASASASADAGAGASDRAVASAIASAFASVTASAYFDTSVALAAASTPTSALSARRWEKVGDMQEMLLEFQAAERARRKADKEAADAHQAHCLIVAKCRRCAEWTAAL